MTTPIASLNEFHLPSHLWENNEELAALAQWALECFAHGCGESELDIKKHSAEFMRALAHLCDRNGQDMAEDLKTAWGGYHQDTDGQGRQFRNAARELGAEDLKDLELEEQLRQNSPTHEQLTEMNRLTGQTHGEPTIEQLEEMFRSVMGTATSALTVAN